MAENRPISGALIRFGGIVGVALAALSVSPAFGAETITYTYDVFGRLVKVVHSGTVNDAVTQNYSFDAADNRINVTVTGSQN
jgi:hypothetical protein